MNKINILFMISNLDSGGVSKAMVNLLTEIDKDRYDITLWIGTSGGLYEDLLPKNIRVIRNRRTTLLLAGTRGLVPLLRGGHIMLAVGSCVRLMLSCVSKAWAGWWLSRMIPSLSNVYDVAIDYNGQQQLYYLIDKIKASKKITFFHSDYKQWPYYYRVDRRYLPHADAICTISEKCADSLKEVFPNISDKVHCVENISSPDTVRRLSEEKVTDIPRTSSLLVTVGHVSEKKGSDLAILAADMMQKRGIDFQWLFIGNISDYRKYDEAIKQRGLEKRMHLLGPRQNPYPYMKEATIIVHPSQFEGKSIALDEAKILCKPIVVTNFSTVRDQFENGVNATICDMTPESLSAAIVDLLQGSAKRARYSSWLREHPVDNRGNISKLYALIDES